MVAIDQLLWAVGEPARHNTHSTITLAVPVKLACVVLAPGAIETIDQCLDALKRQVVGNGIWLGTLSDCRLA